MRTAHQDYLSLTCWRLGRMVIGRAAEDALAAKASGNRLAVLPVWLWLPPEQDMGRKGQSLVPIRVNYPGDSPVVLSSSGNEDEKIVWTAVGAGWDLGSQLLISDDGEPVPSYGPSRSPGELPASVRAPYMGASGVRRRLEALMADGQAARWELVGELHSMTRKYVWRARSAALASLRGRSDGLLEQAFSALDVEVTTDEIVLGAEGRPSRMDSLLERCLLPTTFQRVDPLRYIATSLRCSARQGVNRRLGDPEIGARVRACAAELGLPSHRELTADEVNLVQQRFLASRPGSRLGKSRVAASTATRFLSHLGEIEQEDRVEQRPSVIDQIVHACKAEGGDILAEVAQHWLSLTAAGEQPTDKDMAEELWLDVRQVGWLVEQAREIAAKLLSHGDAA